jgi:hypothetical protein
MTALGRPETPVAGSGSDANHASSGPEVTVSGRRSHGECRTEPAGRAGLKKPQGWRSSKNPAVTPARGGAETRVRWVVARS